MWAPMCRLVCTHEYMFFQRSEEGVGSPRAEVTGHYEPSMNAGSSEK